MPPSASLWHAQSQKQRPGVPWTQESTAEPTAWAIQDTQSCCMRTDRRAPAVLSLEELRTAHSQPRAVRTLHSSIHVKHAHLQARHRLPMEVNTPLEFASDKKRPSESRHTPCIS